MFIAKFLENFYHLWYFLIRNVFWISFVFQKMGNYFNEFFYDRNKKIFFDNGVTLTNKLGAFAVKSWSVITLKTMKNCTHYFHKNFIKTVLWYSLTQILFHLIRRQTLLHLLCCLLQKILVLIQNLPVILTAKILSHIFRY